MHFTGTVYRNPYWPTWPLLEVTQGCTHNKCKFCTMYKDVPFKMFPMEWIEEDLKELGLREISLGSESGDDWTLNRVNKNCSAADITEQCAKLTEAGIDFWLCFLNGVAGKEHSMDHAIHSAELFSKCKPILVGTGGLTLFPGTPLLEEAERGEFTPLTEKEMLIELKVFVEHLTCDCYFNTHHTSGIHLSGPDFLKRKAKIIKALEQEIEHGDMDRLAAIRKNKRSL